MVRAGGNIWTRRGGEGHSGRGHSLSKRSEPGSVSLAQETVWLVCEGRTKQRSWKSLRSQWARSRGQGAGPVWVTSVRRDKVVVPIL